MAQLTWRNVDAPTFTGVTDALRLAGQSLTAGLSAGRDAITDFQKGQTTAESARLVAATAGVTDPTQLQGIISGFDPRHVTPDALKTALARPQDLASLESTKTSTAATALATQFNAANNPLKLENNRLTNTQAKVNLDQDVWKNDVAKKEYAATGDWNQMLTQHRALKSNPDPAAQAQAATLAASPEFAARATAAGVKDLAGVLDKGETAAINATRLKTEYLTLGEKERTTALASTSRSLAENHIAETGSPAGALRRVQEDQTLSPELRTATIKIITDTAGSYAKPTEAEVLAGNAAGAGGAPRAAAPDPASFVRYQNQGATRDKPLAPGLVEAMGFLPQLGISMQVNSGGQDGIETGSSKRTGSTRHDHGGAGDVQFMKDGRALSWENPNDVPVLQQIVKQARANGVTGIGAGPGYMNPTTTHIGFGTKAIWGSKAGPYEALAAAIGDAPAGGDRVQQVLARASQPLARPDLAGPRGAPIQIGPASGTASAAPAFQPGIRLETPQDLAANYQKVQSMLTSATNTSQIDGAFNEMKPIVDAFSNAPEKGSSAIEVAAQLHKKGGDKDDGGWFGRDKLTIESVNQAVQKVVKDYGVTPDIAGSLIESSIQTTGGVLLAKGREVDYGQLKTYIDRFVEKDGTTGKGKIKTDQLNIIAAKAGIEKQVADAKQIVERAREEWVGAEAAAQRGSTRVNVQAARERFANAQRAADAIVTKLSNNPNLTANTASRTNR